MNKLYSSIVAIGAALVFIFLMWYFSSIVWCILISGLLALVSRPIVNALCRIRIFKWHFPKWAAAAVTVSMFVSLIVLFFYTFIPLIISKAAELSSADIQKFVDSLISVDAFMRETFSLGDDFSLFTIISKEVTPEINSTLFATVSMIPSLVANFVVLIFSISFITFFFLKEELLFFKMILSLFPEKYKQNVVHALGSINNLLLRYFTGVVTESAILFVLISFILIILGIPITSSVIIGLTIGVLNVIPYIGFLIGLAVSFCVGVMTAPANMDIHYVFFVIVGTIAVCKMFDDFVMQPFLYSKHAKAHPLEIFLVILIAGNVAGILGMLLAIPSYNVVRVFAKEFFNNFPIVRKLTEKI